MLAAYSKIKAPRNVEVLVCPPSLFLGKLQAPLRLRSGQAKSKFQISSKLQMGAQTCGPETKSGPFTGEVSPAMLKSSGVKYVILGHSERRAMGESDALIAEKMAAAIQAGLVPILCVGEPLKVRKQGRAATLAFVRKQLHSAVKNVPRGAKPILVAYEPIWAISTNEGLFCGPDEAELMVRVCSAHLANQENFGKVIGIYGGSVNHRTASGYLKREYIRGLLVGRDSLNPGHFAKIVELAGRQ